MVLWVMFRSINFRFSKRYFKLSPSKLCMEFQKCYEFVVKWEFYYPVQLIIVRFFGANTAISTALQVRTRNVKILIYSILFIYSIKDTPQSINFQIIRFYQW